MTGWQHISFLNHEYELMVSVFLNFSLKYLIKSQNTTWSISMNVTCRDNEPKKSGDFPVAQI